MFDKLKRVFSNALMGATSPNAIPTTNSETGQVSPTASSHNESLSPKGGKAVLEDSMSPKRIVKPASSPITRNDSSSSGEFRRNSKTSSFVGGMGSPGARTESSEPKKINTPSSVDQMTSPSSRRNFVTNASPPTRPIAIGDRRSTLTGDIRPLIQTTSSAVAEDSDDEAILAATALVSQSAPLSRRYIGDMPKKPILRPCGNPHSGRLPPVMDLPPSLPDNFQGTIELQGPDQLASEFAPVAASCPATFRLTFIRADASPRSASRIIATANNPNQENGLGAITVDIAKSPLIVEVLSQLSQKQLNSMLDIISQQQQPVCQPSGTRSMNPPPSSQPLPPPSTLDITKPEAIQTGILPPTICNLSPTLDSPTTRPAALLDTIQDDIQDSPPLSGNQQDDPLGGKLLSETLDVGQDADDEVPGLEL